MKKQICLVASVGIVAVAAATGLQAQSTSAGVIVSCVSKMTGVSRIVPSSANCSANENVVTWNQTGPQGTTGPQGPQGSTGPTGFTGPSGPTAFIAEMTLPANSSADSYFGALSGVTTATPSIAEPLAVRQLQQYLPDSCTSASFAARVIGVRGPTQAHIFLAKTSPDPINFNVYQTVASCSISVGTSLPSVATCRAAAAVVTPGTPYFFVIENPEGLADFNNASVATTLSCQ